MPIKRALVIISIFSALLFGVIVFGVMINKNRAFISQEKRGIQKDKDNTSPSNSESGETESEPVKDSSGKTGAYSLEELEAMKAADDLVVQSFNDKLEAENQTATSGAIKAQAEEFKGKMKPVEEVNKRVENIDEEKLKELERQRQAEQDIVDQFNARLKK